MIRNELLKRYAQTKINKDLFSTVCISGSNTQTDGDVGFLTLQEFNCGKIGYVLLDKIKGKIIFKK